MLGHADIATTQCIRMSMPATSRHARRLSPRLWNARVVRERHVKVKVCARQPKILSLFIFGIDSWEKSTMLNPNGLHSMQNKE
jgi:hypothetical protein